jgi:AcrR family transcriptional regulator
MTLAKPNTNMYSVYMGRPVQARSRITEEKILAAAERLLADRRFDDLSIAEISEACGVSVGGVYARFASKDALMLALHARYEAYRTAFLTEAFAPAIWRDADLEARVRGVCAAFVTLMRERRAVLRSFLLRYWSKPGDMAGLFSERLGGLYQRAADLVLERRDAIGAADPENATRLALAIIAGACRDIIVMKPTIAPGAVNAADAELVDALTRAAMGVLQAPIGGRGT